MTIEPLETDGILFDMDGVLVSSIASVERCWRQFAALHGRKDAATLEIPHGTRAVDIIRWMVPHLDVEKGRRQIEDIELADLHDTKLLPGARELLQALPPDRWAIVSSASSRLLTGRLKAVGLPVPTRYVSAEMVERGKPDPLPYLRGAELLKLPPSSCVVVEDAPNGVRSGVDAGCRVLGVLGTQDSYALRKEGATWLVPSLASVRAEVNGERITLALKT